MDDLGAPEYLRKSPCSVQSVLYHLQPKMAQDLWGWELTHPGDILFCLPKPKSLYTLCIHIYIYINMSIYNYIYMGVVQNTFSRTALNRSANRVATAVPQ